MKTLITLSLIVLVCTSVWSQDRKLLYTTSGGEGIFSFADVSDNGTSASGVMRWSPMFNLQGFAHLDPIPQAGLFAGLSVRNIGFIYDESETVRKKYRTYTAGIPVGLKLGNLDGTFFFGGYEVEFPFHYREKTFVDNTKEKYGEWFSDRVPQYYQSVFAGVNLKSINLKFKYYLNGFFNQDFTNEQGLMPYANLEANVFYVALSFGVFKQQEKKKKTEEPVNDAPATSML